MYKQYFEKNISVTWGHFNLVNLFFFTNDSNKIKSNQIKDIILYHCVSLLKVTGLWIILVVLFNILGAIQIAWF